MIELHYTETFEKWLHRLKDERAKSKITMRLMRLGKGLTGDAEPVGEGLSELRIHY